MSEKTKKIVGIGLFTAIVIVLQAMAITIRFGIFNISLVLIPIVVGAALYGPLAGAWLGLIFGVVVLFTDASLFLAVNVLGTILTCIVKGAVAGYVAGIVYKAFEKKNRILAVVMAAIVAPICNTGIFLIGCKLFFLETVTGWATAAGYANVGKFMIFGLVGLNFLIEMGINVVLSPVIVRLIKIGKK